MDYPVHLLQPGDTALCLFAAAFLGINDVIHMARNEIQTTCVDIDGEKLNEMADLYPHDWTFDLADAWQFAEDAAETGERWDVVSVDCYTGTATDRSLQTLDLWCSLSNRVVTATVARSQTYTVPEGWQDSLYPRSPLADWLVLTR
jgi:hypothetical protein